MKMKEMKHDSQFFHVITVTDKHYGDHYSYSKKLFYNDKDVFRYMSKQREKGINCVAYAVKIDVFGRIKLDYIGVNYEN